MQRDHTKRRAASTDCARWTESLESRRLLSGELAIGAVGDSYTDEYQFYAPDRSTARNYIEQLAQDRGLNFGAASTSSRGAPRNAGFEFNWAQSADTTADLLADAQVSGLAAQAAVGRVNIAFVFAGGNDFRGVFTSADPVAALGTVVPAALANVFTAVNTLLAASPNLNVVIATLPKVTVLPEVKGAIAAGFLPQALADAVDMAVGAFDGQIRQLAASSNRIALADVDGLVDGIFAGSRLKLNGVTIDRETPSDDSHSLFLVDGLHAGTVGQGLLANLFVNAMDAEFGSDVRPLSTREILQNAGLRPLDGHEDAATQFAAPPAAAKGVSTVAQGSQGPDVDQLVDLAAHRLSAS